MSPEHKAALAEGRRVGKVVRDYLEALDQRNQPARRGRKRTPESIRARLQKINDELLAADVVKRLQLVQEQADLEDELAALEGGTGMSDEDFGVLEQAFVADAKAYADAKGIAYGSWREIGVPAQVLRQAA